MNLGLFYQGRDRLNINIARAACDRAQLVAVTTAFFPLPTHIILLVFLSVEISFNRYNPQAALESGHEETPDAQPHALHAVLSRESREKGAGCGSVFESTIEKLGHSNASLRVRPALLRRS